jgi:anti-sigma-K factor RskA
VSGTDVHQLAAAYALDAVDEHERAEFESHYPTCPVCRPEVAGFRETLSEVAGAVAVSPPGSLKANLMAEIGNTRQLSPLLPESVVDLATHRRAKQRMIRSLSIAAALIVIAVGAFVVGRHSGGEGRYATAAAEVFDQPDARTTALAKTDAATGIATGSFKVVWSPTDKKAVVVADGLPDPGPGKAYELWLVDASGAHAVRLLDKAEGNQVRRVVDVNGQPTQWAVTVEPQAGVDKATGPIIFAGAV